MANNPNYHFLEIPQNIVSYVTDKSKSSKAYFKYLLSRTQMMFKYTNLPETIDPILLERMLQINGVACITKAPNDSEDSALYAFSGSFGGELDIYYRPTKFVVANPHLGKEGFSKEVIVNGTEPHTGVILYNDSEWQGLTPLIARYASLMTENALTVRIADIMLRKMDIIISGTDKAKKSADLFLKQLEDGKLASLSDSTFFESIRTLPVSNYNGSYLIQFIEFQQYLKGSFYNELGLRANYNMKREAIGEGESTLDADSVLPLCENMLNSRRKCIALVNQLFNTNISVDYNSAWLENHIDSYLSIYNKIAESVNTMHAQEQPQFGAPDAPTSADYFGQPMEGVSENDNKGRVGDNGQTDGGDGSSNREDDTISRNSADESSGMQNKGSGDDNKESGDDNRHSTDQDNKTGEPGEQRFDSEPESGVGRELEGTGQDEELIELEEVVEKLIDNVYDDVVGQPTDDDSRQVAGESGTSLGAEVGDESGTSRGRVGGDSGANVKDESTNKKETEEGENDE